MRPMRVCVCAVSFLFFFSENFVLVLYDAQARAVLLAQFFVVVVVESVTICTYKLLINKQKNVSFVSRIAVDCVDFAVIEEDTARQM